MAELLALVGFAACYVALAVTWVLVDRSVQSVRHRWSAHRVVHEADRVRTSSPRLRRS